jgi:hypothetical protein
MKYILNLLVLDICAFNLNIKIIHFIVKFYNINLEWNVRYALLEPSKNEKKVQRRLLEPSKMRKGTRKVQSQKKRFWNLLFF